MRISDLNLNDKIIDIGVRTDSHRIFATEGKTFKPWDFPDNVQVSITYELSRDLDKVNRKVYSILDYLGDIGGLAGALVSLFSAAVMIF